MRTKIAVKRLIVLVSLWQDGWQDTGDLNKGCVLSCRKTSEYAIMDADSVNIYELVKCGLLLSIRTHTPPRGSMTMTDRIIHFGFSFFSLFHTNLVGSIHAL